MGAEPVPDVVKQTAACISAAETIDAALATLVDEAGALLGVAGTVVLLLDAKERKLRPVASTPEETWPHIEKVRIDPDDETSVAAIAARTREPVVVENTQTDPRGKKWLVELYHTRSLLAVPMLANHDVLGSALAIETRRYRRFSDDEVNTLLVLAGAAAWAVKRLRGRGR